jgi:hypothetical protein
VRRRNKAAREGICETSGDDDPRGIDSEQQRHQHNGGPSSSGQTKKAEDCPLVNVSYGAFKGFPNRRALRMSEIPFSLAW